MDNKKNKIEIYDELENENYKVLQREWEDFQWKLKDIEEYFNKIYYDGYRTNSEKFTYEFSKQIKYSIQENQYPVLGNIYTLPQEIILKNWKEIIEIKNPPEFPIIQHPIIKLEDSKYPEWYLKFIEDESNQRLNLVNEAELLQKKIEDKKREFILIHQKLEKEKEELKLKIEEGNIKANETLIKIANLIYPLPYFFKNNIDVLIDEERKIAYVEFEFPDYTNENIIIGYKKKYNDFYPKNATETNKKKLVKNCLYSLIIRIAYFAANYCQKNNYENVLVNVKQHWFDPATGQSKKGIIASMQAKVEILKILKLDKLDPEMCFKNLKGLSTHSFQNINPIRPIFELNKSDDRLISGKDIESNLEPESNLASMEWEDFEHLVAQLFEWEFSKNGTEVKVTRASRDRGVDAILFDPDPIKGGKYVIQAKRYTRTVDVSAVRDLYGTVMNEGANRGILITTAGFGPDAYDFVKDKPISLIDGQILLKMLQKHGKKFRIDIEEAKRLQNQI